MNSIRSQKLKFEGGNGYSLDASLDMPSGEIKCFAIFCHCFTCTKNTLATFRVSRILAQHGYAVLRFDFTGLGDSEGEFANTNFSSNVKDVLAAIKFLRREHRAPELLLGHSMGGTAVLAAAAQTPEVKAVVTIASPSDPEHVLHHFGHALTLLEQGIASSIEVAGQHYDIYPQFIDDIRQHDMQKTLAELNKPVLIFNITHDELVAQSNADEIHQWTQGRSKIITLDDANHVLSDKTDAEFVGNEIVEWYEALN